MFVCFYCSCCRACGFGPSDGLILHRRNPTDWPWDKETERSGRGTTKWLQIYDDDDDDDDDNSIQFFIIYVPSQQLRDQLETQYRVVTENGQESTGGKS
jgi:hypothetical protein